MKILILEDDLNRVSSFTQKLGSQHELICVDLAADAINKLKTERFDVVFLDHDLGGEQMVSTSDKNTGSEVARWLIANNSDMLVPTTVVIHSLNTPAAKMMHDGIVEAGYINVYTIPFTTLLTNYLDDPSFLS